MTTVQRLATRFWIPPDATLDLADGGFLPDPEDAYAAALNPAVVPFTALASLRCLVLIGEPGLGKTTALAIERRALEMRLGPGPDRVLAVDLGSTRDERVLRARLIEADVYTEWRLGDGALYLLLDSLDEARLRVETVADLVLECLQGADLERLYLRFACRSADRHGRLEDALRLAFGTDQFGVFELVPLRLRDVAEAAREAGVDADAFIGEVVERNLQPLANRPLTLRFLLGVAREEGGLPASAAELYRRGCRLLAEEPDEDRRRGTTAGRLTVPQRVAVGSRIAAATILCGRSAVVTDLHIPPSPDEADLEELAGGREVTLGTAVSDSFSVNVEEVREVLGTGLFSARGEGRLGWAHQTLGEFLAAEYLSRGGMRTAQVLDLLTLREDDSRRVIPQLREVAGWLARLSPPLFEALLPGDPDVLLRADVGLADAEQRQALVRALLVGAGDATIERWDARIRSNLGRLVHPGLVAQLREALFDLAAPVRAREMAADVAGACRLSDLAQELANMALDEQAPPTVRLAAVSALDGWADASVRARLVPLALDPPSTDTDDELRGGALAVVWPDILSAEQLFAALPQPRRPSLFGLYKLFLRQKVMAGLSDDDVPVALRWAAGIPRQHHPTDALSDLVQQILVRAWSVRARPEIMQGLVVVVETFLAGGYDLLDHQERQRGRAFADEDGRRELVQALVPAVSRGTVDPVTVALLSDPTLLKVGDFEWLLESLAAARDTADEIGWARLIRAMLPRGVAVEPVMEAAQESSALRELTADWFGAVALESERAKTDRESWRRSEQWRKEREPQATEAPDMGARVTDTLERVEAGDLDAFWHLNLELSVKQGERHYGGEFQSDLTEFPGWQAADATTRDRILTAAERYLRDADPQPDEWFGRNTIWRPAWAGYRALRLLNKLAPEQLTAMGSTSWERWAPIIMAWPRDGVDEAEWNDAAVAMFFRQAPETAARWFAVLLDARLDDDRGGYEVRRLRLVADPVVEALVVERAAREDLPVATRAELLHFLIERGSTEGRTLAEQLLAPENVAAGGTERELAVHVAQILVEAAPDAGWPAVWPRVHVDAAFGRAVFEAVAQYHETVVSDRLDETQMADLYLWLESQYPHASDPETPDGASYMGPRDQIAWWRDRVLRGLAAKGTPEAVTELARVQAELSHLPWISRLHSEAQELVRRSRWTPPAPSDLVRMGADVARRWVASDAELREVVVESLARAQEELQGATPAAADLWDTSAHRPKSENELSDWLKRHFDHDLRGRGVVVGREVQIRPGPGGKMGEAGDLVIEAVAGERVEGTRSVAVTVEVKGCWHRELDVALRTQLAERYLLPEGQRHGVYVVGWFAADDWDVNDWRRAACGARTLEDSRARFAEQARDVSVNFDVEIDAVVLDCSLPPRTGPARRT